MDYAQLEPIVAALGDAGWTVVPVRTPFGFALRVFAGDDEVALLDVTHNDVVLNPHLPGPRDQPAVNTILKLARDAYAPFVALSQAERALDDLKSYGPTATEDVLIRLTATAQFRVQQYGQVLLASRRAL